MCMVAGVRKELRAVEFPVARISSLQNFFAVCPRYLVEHSVYRSHKVEVCAFLVGEITDADRRHVDPDSHGGDLFYHMQEL